MPKDAIKLDLTLEDFSTEELIDELTNRHEEIIIIRENRKDPTWLDIRAKTAFGKYGNENAQFDIVRALDLLHTTAAQLLKDHLDAEKAEDGGSDSPQDSQEAP